jgi:hypothetical protein
VEVAVAEAPSLCGPSAPRTTPDEAAHVFRPSIC